MVEARDTTVCDEKRKSKGEESDKNAFEDS